MIATNKLQARRLITVGISRETADMYLRSSAYELKDGEWVPQESGCSSFIYMGKPNKGLDFPLWSLSALWDIVHGLDKTYDFDTKMSSDELIEILVKTIEYRFKNRTSG